MIKPDTRATLIKFMQLLVAHHPSLRFIPIYPHIILAILKVQSCNLLNVKSSHLGVGREVLIYLSTLTIYTHQISGPQTKRNLEMALDMVLWVNLTSVEKKFLVDIG